MAEMVAGPREVYIKEVNWYTTIVTAASDKDAKVKATFYYNFFYNRKENLDSRINGRLILVHHLHIIAAAHTNARAPETRSATHNALRLAGSLTASLGLGLDSFSLPNDEVRVDGKMRFRFRRLRDAPPALGAVRRQQLQQAI